MNRTTHANGGGPTAPCGAFDDEEFEQDYQRFQSHALGAAQTTSGIAIIGGSHTNQARGRNEESAGPGTVNSGSAFNASLIVADEFNGNMPPAPIDIDNQNSMGNQSKKERNASHRSHGSNMKQGNNNEGSSSSRGQQKKATKFIQKSAASGITNLSVRSGGNGRSAD